MPYREKIAWLSLIAMAVTFAPYFTFAARSAQAAAPLPNLHLLGLYGVAAVARMLILGVGYLYLRRAFPMDAGIPPDERDRAISARSLSSAYGVLLTGMILVGVVMPFQSAGWTIVNAALFMIVAAEFVRYGIVVYSYRRQA